MLQTVIVESVAVSPAWSSELKTYSLDLEESSWKTNFSHIWPVAALPGPCLLAAKLVPSCL